MKIKFFTHSIHSGIKVDNFLLNPCLIEGKNFLTDIALLIFQTWRREGKNIRWGLIEQKITERALSRSGHNGTRRQLHQSRESSTTGLPGNRYCREIVQKISS